MRRFFSVFAALVLAAGCTPELDEEPRCRLTNDGWICDDGASPPDAGNTDLGLDPMDTGEQPMDSGNPPEDMGQEPPPATSCAELKSRGDTGRGTRTIELGGQSTEVFCEQDLEGGGWMLVGRSVAGGGGNFGWGSAVGSLADDNAPYSLGRTAGAPSELLIGNRGDGKSWGNRVYRVALPNDFIASCSAGACATTVTRVTGTCDATAMFNFAGRTQKTDSFWFRDVEGDNPYGLFPNGWNTFYDDCVGGEVNGSQGMVFAR